MNTMTPRTITIHSTWTAAQALARKGEFRYDYLEVGTHITFIGRDAVALEGTVTGGDPMTDTIYVTWED